MRKIISIFLIVLIMSTGIAQASIWDNIKESLRRLDVSHDLVINGYDMDTGTRVMLTAVYVNGDPVQIHGGGNNGYTKIYGGYSMSIVTKAPGYQDGSWSGSSSESSVNVPMKNLNAPTPVPVTTTSPVPTASPTINKPVIIPPTITKLLNLIFGWLGLLSIAGGQSVDVIVNQPYTTDVSLSFVMPDSDYSDGTYQTVFGEWFITDSAKNVKYESGFAEVTTPSYTASAKFTPASPGTYYLVGVVVKQQYTFDSTTNTWLMTETIENKEVQQIVAKYPAVQMQGVKTTSGNVISNIWAWLKNIFPGWL